MTTKQKKNAAHTVAARPSKTRIDIALHLKKLSNSATACPEAVTWLVLPFDRLGGCLSSVRTSTSHLKAPLVFNALLKTFQRLVQYF